MVCMLGNNLLSFGTDFDDLAPDNQPRTNLCEQEVLEAKHDSPRYRRGP
jgi:hypothetical protein